MNPYGRVIPRPEHRTHPHAYSAKELRAMLVADALAHQPTPLLWCIAAFNRIGELERITADAAYQAVRGEVKARGGRGMPMG
jgi:hypothetical protein